MEVARRRNNSGGGGRLQNDFEHAEKWQDSRRRDFRWHAHLNPGVGRPCGRPLVGRVCIPVGKADLPTLSRQSLEAVATEAGEAWATFHLRRNTNASLSKKAGVDPKVASDQQGHGLGVSIEVYTSYDLEQKRAAVNKLEGSVLRNTQPESRSARANLA